MHFLFSQVLVLRLFLSLLLNMISWLEVEELGTKKIVLI